MSWLEIGQVTIFLGALAAALIQIGKLLAIVGRFALRHVWVLTPIMASVRQATTGLPSGFWVVRLLVQFLPFVLIMTPWLLRPARDALLHLLRGAM